MRRIVLAAACGAVMIAGCGGGGGGSGGTSSYTVGGSVTGLTSGATVTLQTSGAPSVTVTANGTFAFASEFTTGSGYAVSIQTQPSNEMCSVNNGSGTVG